MTIRLLHGRKVEAEGDTPAEAFIVYKITNPTHLLYPTDDGGGVHVRIPDADGEYGKVIELTYTEKDA